MEYVTPMQSFSVNATYGKAVRALTYNCSYGPDYPEEDHTELQAERLKLNGYLRGLLDSAESSICREWLELAYNESKTAFHLLETRLIEDARARFKQAMDYVHIAEMLTQKQAPK